jgi:hypothetical protein
MKKKSYNISCHLPNEMLGGGGFQFCDSYVSMWMIENFNVNVQLSKVYCELQMEKIRKLY